MNTWQNFEFLQKKKNVTKMPHALNPKVLKFTCNIF